VYPVNSDLRSTSPCNIFATTSSADGSESSVWDEALVTAEKHDCHNGKGDLNGQFHGLKLQYEFAVEGAAGSVEELAEPRAVEIILYIAVVVALEDVEDAKSDARMALLYREADPAPDL
jgi:hypothetical protein